MGCEIEKAIELLKSFYKKSCQEVNGRLKGGFVNHSQPENIAIDLAIVALREKLEREKPQDLSLEQLRGRDED